MFSVREIDRRDPAQVRALLAGFDADSQVWEIDISRDWLIGDEEDLDPEDVAVLLGTVAEVMDTL